MCICLADVAKKYFSVTSSTGLLFAIILRKLLIYVPINTFSSLSNEWVWTGAVTFGPTTNSLCYRNKSFGLGLKAINEVHKRTIYMSHEIIVLFY